MSFKNDLKLISKTVFNMLQEASLSRVLNISVFLWGCTSIIIISNFRKAVKRMTPLNLQYRVALTTAGHDGRIIKYCGEDYHIIDSKIIRNSSKTQAYSLSVEGKSGKCRIIIKCNKITHAELKSMMKEQLAYTKLSKEEKENSTFIPTDFNDMLIPTKETYERIKQVLKDYPYILEAKYSFNDIIVTDELKKIARIDDQDTFLKLSNIVIIDGKNLVAKIKPEEKNIRSYDIEDTYYMNETYLDVLHKITDFNIFEEAFNQRSQLKYQQISKEIIDQKKRRDWMIHLRWKVALLTMTAAVGFTIWAMKVRPSINYSLLSTIQSNIENNSDVISMIGNNKVMCFSYHLNPFYIRYNIYGLIIGKDSRARMIANTENLNINKIQNCSIQVLKTNNQLV